MKRIIYIALILVSPVLEAQETLSEVLNRLNNKSIPYISVSELALLKTNAIILDSRELNEYEVSHLKDAIYVGYDTFNLELVLDQVPNKDTQIIVYCSLGIRSEDIAETLTNEGYSNVFNLYGGIFEWKNKGFPVYDKNENETENIHVCNEYWSTWLLKGTKIYD